MNKYLIPLMLAFLFMIVGTSCIDSNCIEADRNQISETLDVSGFDRIELDLPARVFLTQSNTFDVRVEGPANIIERLDLDVQAGRWEITINDCVRDLDEMTFFISLPEIRELNLNGSGAFISEDTFAVDEVILDLDGSGEFDLSFLANDIDVKLDGSGTFDLDGQTDILRFDLDGSGRLSAFGMDAIEVFVRIDGSGNADVFASDFLQVLINGSGDVRYRGQPQLDVEINGSGSISDAN